MISNKTLYAYNKDTGRREEFQIEVSSATFATNALNDGNGISISDNYLRKPIKGNFTVNQTQWIQDNTESGVEFAFYHDISISGITSTWTPAVVFDAESQPIVTEEGFICIVESLKDKIRLKCKEKPTGDISGFYYVTDM